VRGGQAAGWVGSDWQLRARWAVALSNNRITKTAISNSTLQLTFPILELFRRKELVVNVEGDRPTAGVQAEIREKLGLQGPPITATANDKRSTLAR
jgi:hypothetical protein